MNRDRVAMIGPPDGAIDVDINNRRDLHHPADTITHDQAASPVSSMMLYGLVTANTGRMLVLTQVDSVDSSR